MQCDSNKNLFFLHIINTHLIVIVTSILSTSIIFYAYRKILIIII